MSQSDAEGVRRRILSDAVVVPDIAATLLLETVDPTDRSIKVSAVFPAGRVLSPNLTLPADSLLIKWLRTNNAYLAIPDGIGIWEELPGAEQETLRNLGISGCVPLLVLDELIACLGFITNPGGGRSIEWTTRVMRRTPSWAGELRDVQRSAKDAIQREAVARSNRLNLTGQLAASVAHEVRNPLAAIRSTLQTIRDDDIPAGNRKRLLSTILDDVDRVNRVVSDMMTLGRPRASRYERCDLADVIRDATAFCSAYAKRSGLQIEGQPFESVTVDADPAELRQVLVNLLLNACQASHPPNRVRIALTTAPHKAVIAVIDRGAGMTPADHRRAFEPFFSTKIDGGGLGLAICLDIVRRHGGDLTLTSQLGQGTTAIVTLPA